MGARRCEEIIVIAVLEALESGCFESGFLSEYSRPWVLIGFGWAKYRFTALEVRVRVDSMPLRALDCETWVSRLVLVNGVLVCRVERILTACSWEHSLKRRLFVSDFSAPLILSVRLGLET